MGRKCILRMKVQIYRPPSYAILLVKNSISMIEQPILDGDTEMVCAKFSPNG